MLSRAPEHAPPRARVGVSGARGQHDALREQQCETGTHRTRALQRDVDDLLRLLPTPLQARFAHCIRLCVSCRVGKKEQIHSRL